jgi:hypothetical protein
MCCNIDATNVGQTLDDRINWCLDVTILIGCTVMLMIEMSGSHLMDMIAWCSIFIIQMLDRHLMARIA